MCEALILTLSKGVGDLVVYSDVFIKGLGDVLMQRGRMIVYALRNSKPNEANYPTRELELWAVVFTLKI